MCIRFHSKEKCEAAQRGGVTHGAHSRGQVLPAQLEDGQGAVARHIPDVGTEALGSCGRKQEQIHREQLWVWVDIMVWIFYSWLVVLGGGG